MLVSDKNNLLFQKGVNFNELPNWQKRGIGFHWEEYIKESFNPRAQETVTALRKKIKVDYNYP